MINDKIRPMEFNLAKNLHGHVRVETRDRWTGRVVDSQEKDNLVTNAVQKMLLTTAFSQYGMAANWTPIYAKILGGVFLFDGALTESADNIKFPSNVKLVAYAGQVSNTDEAIGGSLNGEESVPTANGFTTVWDFATSQANGTIASLARTSYAFNISPAFSSAVFNYGLGTSAPNGYTYYLGYDDTNKCIYFATGSSSVASLSTIYKHKQDFSKIRLYNQMPPASEWEAFKVVAASDGSNQARYWTYDAYSNNFVYPTAGATIHILDINGSHSTISPSGTSGQIFAVTENYYWRTPGNGTLYRIEKANPANVQSIAITVNNLAPGDNDIVFGMTAGSGLITYIIYPDGTIKEKKNLYSGFNSSSYRRFGPFYAQSQTGGSGASGANSLLACSNYLGTIANLDSPVTKSSSQTMKITYTLTEA